MSKYKITYKGNSVISSFTMIASAETPAEALYKAFSAVNRYLENKMAVDNETVTEDLLTIVKM